MTVLLQSFFHDPSRSRFREHLLWEDKMRTKEESLKMREESVRREKMEYDQTLHNEVTK